MAAEDYDPEFPTGDENGEWSPSRAGKVDKASGSKKVDKTQVMKPSDKATMSESCEIATATSADVSANLSKLSLVTETVGKWEESSIERDPATKMATTQPKLGFKGFKWNTTATVLCSAAALPLSKSPSPQPPSPPVAKAEPKESKSEKKAEVVDHLASPAIKELLAPVVKYEAPALMAESEYDDDDFDFDLPFPPDMEDDTMYDLQMCMVEPPPPPPPPPLPIPIPLAPPMMYVPPCVLAPLVTQIPPPLLLPPPPPPPLPRPPCSAPKEPLVGREQKYAKAEKEKNEKEECRSVMVEDVPLPPEKPKTEEGKTSSSPAKPDVESDKNSMPSTKNKTTPSKPSFIGRDAFLSQLKKDTGEAEEEFSFTSRKKPTIKFGAFKSLLENLGDAVVGTDKGPSVSDIALPASSQTRASRKGASSPAPHRSHHRSRHHASHSHHRSRTHHSPNRHHRHHHHHHHHHRHHSREKSRSEERSEETYGIEVVSSHSHSHHVPTRTDAAHVKGSTHRPSRFSPAYATHHVGPPRTFTNVPIPQDVGVIGATPPARTLVQVYPPPCPDTAPCVSDGSPRALRPLLPRPLQALPVRTQPGHHVVRPPQWTPVPAFLPPVDLRQPPPGFLHTGSLPQHGVQVTAQDGGCSSSSAQLDERTQVSNVCEDPELKASANVDPRLKSPCRAVNKPQVDERWVDTSGEKTEEQEQKRPTSPSGQSCETQVLTRENSNSSGEVETEEASSVETATTTVTPVLAKKGRRKKGQKGQDGSNSDGTTPTRRRSSRIKSLEERKEKERAEKEKEKVAACGGGGGGGPGLGPSLANRPLPCENGDDSNSTLSGTETGVRQCPSSRQSPRVGNWSPGASQNSDDGVSPKPEKVKSRWRRNSELERAEKTVDGTNGNVVGSDAARALVFQPIASKTNRPALLPTPALHLNGEVGHDADGGLCPTMATQQAAGEEKMPRFDVIPENIYLTERRKCKINKEVRRMVCDCTISKEEVARGFVACGEDCLNRLLMIECGSRCPTGDLCSNKRFQKREFSKAEAFKTAKKGWGLRALEDLPEGSFIMEYVGEVLDPREFRRRVKEYARDNNQHHYFMALRADEIIDATQKGNLSRFINHSCSPNSETQKWTVNGDLRIGFFTRQFVSCGEEITFDYQFQRYGKEAQRCYCESDCCRGFIGGENQAPIKKDLNLKKEVAPAVQPRKKKQIVEERRKEFLDDKDLEEEIEKLCAFGGLRNRNHTLTLARLMVRAVNVDSRMTLLNLMQKTTEQACLRLFLDYHGLSLMWSWMVDISNTEEMIPLKIEILKTLRVLPITNKTMVLDNKLMSVVQRWSAQIAQQSRPPSTEEPTLPLTAPAVEEPDSEPCAPLPTPPTITATETDEIATEVNSMVGEDPKMVEEACFDDKMDHVMTGEAGSEIKKVEGVVDEPHAEEAGIDEDAEAEKPVLNEFNEDLAKSKSNEDDGAVVHSEKENEKLTLSGLDVEQEDDGLSSLGDVYKKDAEEPMEVSTVSASEAITESGESTAVDPDGETHGAVVNTDSKTKEEENDVEMKEDGEELEPKIERETEREPKSQDENNGSSLEFKEPLVPLPETCTAEISSVAETPSSESCSVTKPAVAEKQEAPVLSAKKELEEKVTTLANSLLETWSCLKEAFRIPKREQNESRREHEREADRRESEWDRRGKDLTWDRSRDRYSDRFDREPDKYKNDRKRPWDSPDQTKDKDRKAKNENKFAKMEDNADAEKPKKYLLPTPTRMSKEERRQLFELKVQQEEADALRRQIEEATVIRRQQEEEEFFRRQQQGAMMAAMVADPNAPPGAAIYYETPFPGYFDPNAGFIAAVAGPSPNVNQALPPGMMNAVSNNPTPVMNPMENHAVTNPVAIVQVNSVTSQPSSVPIADMAVAAEEQHSFTPPQTPVVFSAPNAYQPSQVLPVQHTVPSIGGAPNTTPVPNFSQSANHFAPSPAQTVYYSTPQGVVLHLPDNAQPWPGPLVQIVDDVPPPPVLPKAPKVTKLPPSWKSAKDAEGRTYYYHAVTRQTQWEPPTWDRAEESTEGDLATMDEPKVTTTAAADTSSELARRTKELFRTKMSQFMVQCLNPYRKPDCQLGRITCTDDFKHLARKLTHFVMAKELKYCRNVEDLECNDNVKHKTKDFVKKYMIKFGPIYKKAATSPHYE